MAALIRHFKLMADGVKPPKGEAYASIESSKGELGFYIVSDGTNKPYRVQDPSAFISEPRFDTEDDRGSAGGRRGRSYRKR